MLADALWWAMHGWRYSRRHEISSKLRWKGRGYCLKHRERLYPRGEWFTWECRSCRIEQHRWD